MSRTSTTISPSPMLRPDVPGGQSDARLAMTIRLANSRYIDLLAEVAVMVDQLINFQIEVVRRALEVDGHGVDRIVYEGDAAEDGVYLYPTIVVGDEGSIDANELDTARAAVEELTDLVRDRYDADDTIVIDFTQVAAA